MGIAKVYPDRREHFRDNSAYSKRSLGVIPIDSPVRKLCLRLVTGSRFDAFILTLIVFNSVAMASVDYRFVDEYYEPTSADSWRNRAIEIAEVVFMVVFMLECAIKITALGFVAGKKAYLRSSWNVFDFIIVVLSVISVVPSLVPIIPVSNLSVLKSFRVLRPLRSVSKLPGLKKIIGALMGSARDLLNVMFLLAFLITCFSITGMLFWNGLLHARCRLTPFPVVLSSNCENVNDLCWDEYIRNVTAAPDKYRCLPDANDDPGWSQSSSPWYLQGPQDCIWPIDEGDERICNLNGNGYRPCTPLTEESGQITTRTCGSNYDAFGNPRFIDSNVPFGFSRMKSGTFIEALNWGFTNYDSFLSAFLTTFQVITLEGWTNIMNQIIDAWSFAPTVAIFCVQVVFLGYIVLNLVLAVITKSLDDLDSENDADVGYNSNLHIIHEEENSQQEDDEEGCLRSKDNDIDKSVLEKIMSSHIHDSFIMICIILNTLVLGLDHYGISDNAASVLEEMNTVFTAIFILDVILCNIAFGVKVYWSDPFMCFDGIIGTISLVELILIYSMPSADAGSSSFSVFRSLRLFRIFKMAKNWKSLQSLLRTIVSSINEVGNFAALLILFMFIYSLVGMQILSNRLHFSNENGNAVGITDEAFGDANIPRPNFDNFFWSMVTVFQILTGENWNSIMYDCWKARGWLAVAFVISLIIIGVFIVMNMFLAILLKNFEDSGALVDSSKLDEALEAREKNVEDPDTPPRRPTTIQILWAKIGKNNKYRKMCFGIVENPKFDSVTTILIIGSSISLAIDNPLLNPDTGMIRALSILDLIFTSLFIGEMVVKVLAYGLIFEKGAYLRSSWNVLDFTVVVVSILNLANIGPGGALKALRTLRVLRPLRMVNRLPELKIVVDALLLSFPSVADVAVLCALFFLIFASFGVNFLKGTFYHCEGEALQSLTKDQREYLTNPFEWGLLSDSQRAWFDVNVMGCDASSWAPSKIATSKEICNCLAPNKWKLVIPQNFDNVVNGMALLFEISTTEGWTDVMYAAIDQRGIGMQPVRNSKPIWALFFICFIIVGAFFVLELFVGVTIDNFNKIRAKTGRALMTEGQRNWARTQQFVLKIRPMRRIEKPTNKLRAKAFSIVMPDVNPKFEHFITACIILSSTVAASASFGDSEEKIKLHGWMNLTFAAIFTIEGILKIVALKKTYFDDKWNIFDFSVVCSTNVGLLIGLFVESTGPFIAVIRLARICRLFRLVKNVKSLRALFNTLVVSIPSIANIGSLLLLLFFVYAVVGVQLYSFIPNTGVLNDQANFRSFGTAMLVLLRFSTGENWNGFMRSMISDRKGCDLNPIYNPDSPWCLNEGDYPACTPLNGCGAGLSAYIYFYSFTLLVSFVILNLFVGIVLEAFETSGEGDILSSEDLDEFIKAWAQFDPNATWSIKAEDMKKLLMYLKPPLGVGIRDAKEADIWLDDPCLKEIPVDKKGEVNIVHAATSLAKRLTVKKLGEEFHELSEDHPLQRKFNAAGSSSSRTLDQIFLERSRKKLRILRAIVNMAKSIDNSSSNTPKHNEQKVVT